MRVCAFQCVLLVCVCLCVSGCAFVCVCCCVCVCVCFLYTFKKILARSYISSLLRRRGAVCCSVVRKFTHSFEILLTWFENFLTRSEKLSKNPNGCGKFGVWKTRLVNNYSIIGRQPQNVRGQKTISQNASKFFVTSKGIYCAVGEILTFKHVFHCNFCYNDVNAIKIY